MDLLPTAEQRSFGDTLRGLLRADCPSARMREVIAEPPGWDRPLWQRLAGELGVLGPGIPAGYGGFPGGVRELAVVATELGRALAPVPFLGAALAARALARGADRDRLLPGLLAGRSLVLWAPGGQVSERDGALHGRVRLVPHGAAAEVLLVPGARDVYLVPGESPRLTRIQLSTMDPTRPACALELSGVPARGLGAADPARLVEEIEDLAAILLAAEQIGGAAACLDLAVAHVRRREQFGRPIGSFQAVQHRCADMYVTAQLAEAAAWHAACAADLLPAEAPVAARVAVLRSADAYCRIAADTVHLHGGLGFTWEHDAQLHYRRARAGAQLLGGPVAQRAVLAERLGV